MGCILGGSTAYGNASPCDGVPIRGVPHYMGMHAHIAGYLSISVGIPIQKGNPVFGDACPYAGVPQYTGHIP